MYKHNKMMEEEVKKERITQILELIDESMKFDRKYIIDILDLKKEFLTTLDSEKAKLPYQINIIDEIRANENAHNRIFARLLQYKDGNRFVFLEKFLGFLGEPFSQIKIIKPVITAELNRIDIRIRDKNFSLIIENKINFAQDQDNQINRYLEIEQSFYTEKTIKDSQFYALYLTRMGGSPSKNSLSDENKENLGGKYREINYRDHILQWIIDLNTKGKLKINHKKEKLLKSAIMQYQNFLEGLFFLRDGEQNMKKNMEKLINEKLRLNSLNNLSEKHDIASDYLRYANELQTYLSGLVNNLKFEAFKILEEQILNSDFAGLKFEQSKEILPFGKTGSYLIISPINWKQKYSIRISFGDNCNNMYYGVFNSDSNSPQEIIDTFNNVLKDNETPNKTWPYGKYIYKEESDLGMIKIVEMPNELESFLKVLKKGINEIINEVSKSDVLKTEIME